MSRYFEAIFRVFWAHVTLDFYTNLHLLYSVWTIPLEKIRHTRRVETSHAYHYETKRQWTFPAGFGTVRHKEGAHEIANDSCLGGAHVQEICALSSAACFCHIVRNPSRVGCACDALCVVLRRENPDAVPPPPPLPPAAPPRQVSVRDVSRCVGGAFFLCCVNNIASIQ